MIINLSDFRPQVAQLTEDMENLLDAAEKLFSGGLLKDDNNDPDISINYGAWEKYRKILYGFMAAEEDGCNLLCIRYAEAPSIINNFSRITVTFNPSCTFTEDEKTAFAMADLLSDKTTTKMDGKDKEITFTVSNIW